MQTCQRCQHPIRVKPHPKAHGRKYCTRKRCVAAGRAAWSLASYYRDHAANVQRQRDRYDPAKRRGRYAALTPKQRAAQRVTARRYQRAHRDELNAKARATYDPAARRADYVANLEHARARGRAYQRAQRA